MFDHVFVSIIGKVFKYPQGMLAISALVYNANKSQCTHKVSGSSGFNANAIWGVLSPICC